MTNLPKILLFGRSGQLGQTLYPYLLKIGRVIVPDRYAYDFCCVEQVKQLLEYIKPDVIVNAAAYTAVDLAEINQSIVFQVNAVIPAILARWAEKHQAFLIHYSTDYVFDGNKAYPYNEQDQIAPLNQYGKSKIAGEHLIQKTAGQFLILRTGWLYSRYRNNFMKTMVKNLQTYPILRVVDDQIGGPTSTEVVAQASCHLLKRWQQHATLPYGLYHIAPKGKTSWYEYVLFISQVLQNAGILVKTEIIEPISTDAYGATAKRPKYSVLDTQKIQNAFNFSFSAWQTEMQTVLMAYLSTS